MELSRDADAPGSGIVRMLQALVAAAVLFGCAPAVHARVFLGRFLQPRNELERTRRCIAGQIIDFTCNNGTDCRLCSAALGQKRDMYVYLPPNYDPHQQYPLIIYLHGFSQDEKSFLDLAPHFDQAVRCGVCPPTIIAAPDGSIRGEPSLVNAGSFFINSRAGRFEDFIMQDVWNFMHTRFPIRPEREAHALVGGSMGGFSAYNLGIKYRDAVHNVAGVFPPLNLRYIDCHGRYFADFNPNCIGWREAVRPKKPVARYYGGLLTIRQRRFIDPLYGRRPGAISRISQENPVEMLETYDLQPGQLAMFIGYGGKDEFNIDAQVESFLYFAKFRGICPTVAYIRNAHHTVENGKKLFPAMMQWIGERLAPYGPCAVAKE